MAGTVAPVQTTAAGSGAGVAVDRVGTTDYQLIKLVAGQVSGTAGVHATTAAPTTDAVGLVVRPVGTVPVSVATGTVSVSGPVTVGGTVTAVGTVAISGTGLVSVVPGVSVLASVQGTVGLSSIAPVTTQASVSVTGLPVWWNPSATVRISPTILTVNTAPTVAGASITIQQGATVTAIIPGTVVVTGSIVYSGTQLVSVVPGLSINALVTGPVSISNVVPVTTQASVSATGFPVWWNATATVRISPTILTVNTAATVAGASVTIQQGATVTAIVPGTVVVTGSVAHSGTGLVSVVPGVSVLASVQGTVSLLSVALVTTQASVSVSGLPVWFHSTATLRISPTVLTVNTAPTIAGASVTVAGSVAMSGTGLVSVVPGVSVNLGGFATALVTATAVTTGTGAAVWVMNPASVTVNADAARTNILITITSTSVGISGTTMPFAIYVGVTAPAAGTTSYVVPSGKTLRLLAMDAIVLNSVTTSPAVVRLHVLASTALPTWTSAVPVIAQLAIMAASQTIPFPGAAVQVADVPAGVTVALAHSIGTSGASIAAAAVRGYLFP